MEVDGQIGMSRSYLRYDWGMEIGHISYSLARSVRQILRFVADSVETSSENKKSDNAAGGGVLNFRTDTLDDGTDPAGWYGDD